MRRSLASIKDEVISYKGKLVRCRMSKGRNKIEETEGVLLDTYPKIFTLFDKARESTVSFSYAELLTREVQIEVIQQTPEPVEQP